MTSLTRAYLAEKTSETWAQPMRRWTDAFTPAQATTILIDQTPLHDELKREAYEAEVEKARQELEARKVKLPAIIDVPSRTTVTRVVRHRRSRRWRRE